MDKLFRIDEAVYERIGQLSHKLDISKKTLIERAVTHYLEMETPSDQSVVPTESQLIGLAEECSREPEQVADENPLAQSDEEAAPRENNPVEPVFVLLEQSNEGAGSPEATEPITYENPVDSMETPSDQSVVPTESQLIGLVEDFSKKLEKYSDLLESGKLLAQMGDLSKQFESYFDSLKKSQAISTKTVKMMEGIHDISKSIEDRNGLFVDTHNKTITSLNNVGIAHHKALQNFLYFLEKKSTYILEYNKILEITKRESRQISETFRSMNTRLIDNIQYLQAFRSTLERQIFFAAKESLSFFFRTTKWLLIGNIVFILSLILLHVKGL